MIFSVVAITIHQKSIVSVYHVRNISLSKKYYHYAMSTFFIGRRASYEPEETQHRSSFVEVKKGKRRSSTKSIVNARSTQENVETKKLTHKVAPTVMTLWPPDKYKYLEVRDDLNVEVRQ